MSIFYHYTGVEFETGDELTPQPDGYCHWEENAHIEDLLEQHRPTHCIPRKEAVFVTNVRCDGECYGAASNDFELSIKPCHDILEQRSDICWLSQMEQGYGSIDEMLEDFSEEELASLARGYWSGLPFGKTPKFEYRTRSSIVISVFSKN